MKIKGIGFLYIPLLLLTAAGCYWLGRRDVWIWEYKTYDANLIRLTEFDTNHPPELREFMKGRYYYIANKVPKSWLGSPCDYGPVSTNVAHLGVGKGDTSAGNEYRIFKERSVPLRPTHGNQSNSSQ